MPPRRLLPIAGPTVTLIVDGRDVQAREGESVADAIIASGRWVFGRSVKYHRARGPVCFQGRCEGCLLRIDGVPSVMSCRTPARHGMRCQSQNVLGSAQHDLLAMTDFLFPEGLDHHEMFTWSKPANRAMQLIAREIAGVGTLPDAVEMPSETERHDVDVLVVGASLAGLTLARALAPRHTVMVLDEERALPAVLDGLAIAMTEAGAKVALGRSAIGVFTETGGRRIVLSDSVWGEGGAASIAPRVIVIAAGSAELGGLFEGNDLPGIVSASGAQRLLDRGIAVGQQVALMLDDAEEAAADLIETRLQGVGSQVRRVATTSVRRARGRRGVQSLDTEHGSIPCDAVVLASRRAPQTELAQQAGAKVHFEGDRFVLEVNEDGSTAHPATFVVGSAAGCEGDAVLAQCALTVAAIERALEVPRG